jgi:phosphoribosylformylglycinamidine cyclo-ligase
LSGFCVGAAEKPDLIDPARIEVGDKFIGYPSDGFHANGWSLIRRVLEANPGLIDEEEWVQFLAPTRLYHDVVAGLRERSIDIKAMAHITGGGLPENLERLLNGKGADITIPRWELGAVAKVLSFVEDAEAVKTFNMGWGWVVVVPASEAEAAASFHEGARIIGEVDSSGEVKVHVSS